MPVGLEKMIGYHPVCGVVDNIIFYAKGSDVKIIQSILNMPILSCSLKYLGSSLWCPPSVHVASVIVSYASPMHHLSFMSVITVTLSLSYISEASLKLHWCIMPPDAPPISEVNI